MPVHPMPRPIQYLREFTVRGSAFFSMLLSGPKIGIVDRAEIAAGTVAEYLSLPFLTIIFNPPGSLDDRATGLIEGAIQGPGRYFR
jgi:hypothetical protein